MNSLKKNIYLSILLGFGLVLSLIENSLPSVIFIPGAKLGLINIIILTSLIFYGLRDTLILSVLKSLLLMLLSGNVVAFIYSLGSGIVSSLAMGFTYNKFYLDKKYFSLLGISIIGSIFHNITQVLIASFIIKNLNILIYLPVLNIVSIVTGSLVGIATKYLKDKLNMINRSI